MNIESHSKMKKNCLCCLKKVEGSSRCSKCRTALYCSRECQLKHWPVHKVMCIDSNCEYSAEKTSKKALNYQNQGNYRKAEMLFRKALDIVRQEQGESTLTLHCVENVAQVCSRQGKHKEAVELFKECLEKRQALLGKNHPDTLKAMGFLAAAYGEQGGNGYEQSSLLYSQCFEIQKLVLGPTHRDTLETMGLLAYVLSKQGKLLEAASLFEECLKEQNLILGENNCTTILTKKNLATNYFAQGRFNEVVLLLQGCLDSEKLVLGESHPITLLTMHELAMAYIKYIKDIDNLSRLKLFEVVKLLQQCLARRMSVLGKSHPDTVETASVLGKLRDIVSDVNVV